MSNRRDRKREIAEVLSLSGSSVIVALNAVALRRCGCRSRAGRRGSSSGPAEPSDSSGADSQ
jgi:hypothetical protein